MIRVACLNYNNTVLCNFFHDNITIEYYDNLNLIDYDKYRFIIIFNDKDNMDIFKCLDIIKKRFDGVIYVIDNSYNESIVEKIFKNGADDYLISPIKNSYLSQKIINKNQLIENKNNNYFEYKNLVIDFNAYVAYIDNDEVLLTNIEFELLKNLISNINKAISRKELLLKVWGYNTDDSRTLETHIKTLRKKLKKYRSNIVTIWGYGYAFME